MKVHRSSLIAFAVGICVSVSWMGGEPAWSSDGQSQSGQSQSADWAQWRGPNRDGFVSKSNWPSSLSEGSLVKKWNVPLSESYSGPLIVGDRVFVTETVDKKREVVRALDRATGRQIWEAGWEGALSVPFFAKANGDWIRATPAYDSGRLYVAGIRDVLVCLDATNGKTLWQVDFVAQMKTEPPTFGFVCSPLVDGQFVYVQAGGGFVKVDKVTGKVVWKKIDDGGGMNGSAFSSPYIAELGGLRQMLVQTRTTLTGVDIESGDKLWSRDIPAMRGMNILTPTVFEGSVFTSSYGGKSLLVGIDHEGAQWKASERWSQAAEGYMSSPIIIGHYAYLHLRNQRFTCIDLRNGEAKWKSIPFGKYCSLVANEDRILALDERGELLMLRANPEKFELIEKRKLTDDQTWAHLAVAPNAEGNNQIAIRELKSISFFDWK